MRLSEVLSEKQWTRGHSDKGFLINLGIQWIIGALRSDKEGIREKAIDGLKKIPDEELLKGINGMKS